MKIRCDALSDKFNAGSAYCNRRATWVAVWGAGDGRLYYCGNHKRYRQLDVSLGDRRKLKDNSVKKKLKRKPAPKPIRRCHLCGDSYEKPYLHNGWLLVKHPTFCPVVYRNSNVVR